MLTPQECRVFVKTNKVFFLRVKEDSNINIKGAFIDAGYNTIRFQSIDNNHYDVTTIYSSSIYFVMAEKAVPKNYKGDTHGMR